MPFLLPFLFGQKRLRWRELPQMAALGALGIGIGQVAQAYGVAGTSASVGTIISATIPIFVVVLAAVRLHQPVSALQKAGLAAAFGVIFLVALDGESAGASGTSAAGVLWMLASSLAIASYYVWSVELSVRYGTGVLAAWSTSFGLIALLPWAGWEMLTVHVQPTAVAVGAAIYLGAVVTVAGLFMWLNILRTVPAPMAASIQYLQPIIGIAAAAALFGDRLGLYFALGVLLVICGLALTVARRARG